MSAAAFSQKTNTPPAERSPSRPPAMVLCSATQLDVLEDWFSGAAPGHRAEYARGFVPPREAPAFKRAGALARQGLAMLATDRDPLNPEVVLYLIIKIEPAATKPPTGEVEAPKVKRIDLKAMQETSLMKKLRLCAARAEETPSYADLAEHLAMRRDSRGKRRVRYLLEGLENAGRIKMHPGDAERGPAITITEIGRARGKSTKRAMHQKGGNQ